MTEPLQPPPPPPHAAATTDSWFRRNWWWSLPGGCCGCLMGFALFFAAIALLVFSMFRSSDVYEEALVLAQSDPAVQAELGTPVEPGWMILGNMETTNGSGTADLTIPLSGPDGSGTMYLKAEKRAGQWTFTHLSVNIDDSAETINLLEAD